MVRPTHCQISLNSCAHYQEYGGHQCYPEIRGEIWDHGRHSHLYRGYPNTGNICRRMSGYQSGKVVLVESSMANMMWPLGLNLVIWGQAGAELFQAQASLDQSTIEWTLSILIYLDSLNLKIFSINLLYVFWFCRFTTFGLVLLAWYVLSGLAGSVYLWRFG